MSDGSYTLQSTAAIGRKVYYNNPGTEVNQIEGGYIGAHSAIVVVVVNDK